MLKANELSYWSNQSNLMRFTQFFVMFFFMLLNSCNSKEKFITTPRVKVLENKFVGANNEVIQFKGMNASDPDRLEKEGMWTQSYFDEMNSWGANLIRFPMHPSAWRERGQEAYLDLIDQGIAMAEKSNMYVILDWHSIGNLETAQYQHERYYTTKEETFEFWEIMAKRYGSNPTVAFFEFFNEPTTIRGELGQLTWQQWKSINEELIDLVRKHDAEAIPLIAGFDWAYELHNVMEHPIDAEDVAYVSHPYPMKRKKPWESAWESDWGHVSDKYPVILTEVGFCTEEEKGAHVPVIDDGTYVKAITDYADSKGVSLVIWVFDDLWSPSLIKDWDFTPSISGQVWKDYLSASDDTSGGK